MIFQEIETWISETQSWHKGKYIRNKPKLKPENKKLYTLGDSKIS